MSGTSLDRSQIGDRWPDSARLGGPGSAGGEGRAHCPELGQGGVAAELGVLRGVHSVQRDPAVGVVISDAAGDLQPCQQYRPCSFATAPVPVPWPIAEAAYAAPVASAG